MPFEIIYECEKILCVNKPGGLLTQAPSGIDSIEFRIKRYLKGKNPPGPPLKKNPPNPTLQKGGVKAQGSPEYKTYLGVPHRLDRAASGVMIFAKDKRTARYLADRFQRREVRKTYWTLVSGNVSPEQGTWMDFMRKIPDEAKSELVQQSHPDAQLAVLKYQVKQHTNNTSLLEIALETGRSHQIRVQASARGYPILGDAMYGSQIKFGPPSEDQRLRWIALHARQLEVRHPATGEELKLTAEIAEVWNEWL